VTVSFGITTLVAVSSDIACGVCVCVCVCVCVYVFLEYYP
jgi:uncharacterized membrane protein